MIYNFGSLEEKRKEISERTNKKIRLGKMFYPFFGFVLVNKAKKEQQEFAKGIKSSVVKMIVANNYQSAVYFENQTIDIPIVMNTRLYRIPAKYEGEDLITGVYKGVIFETSDLRLIDVVKTHQRYADRIIEIDKEIMYFFGRWYHFEFKRKLSGEIRIIEKSKSIDSLNNLEGFTKMETESMDFNNKFDAYVVNKEYFFYLMTPRIIDKILNLDEITRGKMRISFSNNKLDIGISDGRDYLEPKFDNPITEEGYRDIISQIEIIGAIINEFGLDGQKFNLD